MRGFRHAAAAIVNRDIAKVSVRVYGADYPLHTALDIVVGEFFERVDCGDRRAVNVRKGLDRVHAYPYAGKTARSRHDSHKVEFG